MPDICVTYSFPDDRDLSGDLIAISQDSTVNDFKARIQGKYNMKMNLYYVLYKKKLQKNDEKIASFYNECGDEEISLISQVELSYKFFDSPVDEAFNVMIPLDSTVGEFKKSLREQGHSDIDEFKLEYNTQTPRNDAKFASFWNFKSNSEVMFFKESKSGS